MGLFWLDDYCVRPPKNNFPLLHPFRHWLRCYWPLLAIYAGIMVALGGLIAWIGK